MNNQTDMNAAELPDSVAPATARHAQSKRQIKAAALANERLARQQWKSILADARSLWGKVPAEDLTKVNGNIHVLAGLVQLRYHTSREEADRQVQKFFLDHPPAAEATRL